jgi:hypothetical protein
LSCARAAALPMKRKMQRKIIRGVNEVFITVGYKAVVCV